MKVQQKEDNSKGSFYIQNGGDIIAEMKYTVTGKGSLIIDHTFVNEVWRGKNIGYHLVKAAADYARSDNIRIFPVCTFAKATLERHEKEFADVILNREDHN